MVFTIFDRILGGIPNFRQMEAPFSLVGHLRNEGFSFEEASSVAWMIDHRMRGEIGGAALGLGTVYFCDNGIRRLCLKLPFVGIRWLGLNGVRAAIVGLFYMSGGFLSTFPHKGSNTHLSSMQSNDFYIKSRSHFINNFDVQNRNFTKDEIEQFLNNEDLKRLGKRKYIYNPMVFDSEAEYADFYERMNNGVYNLSQNSVNKIISDNRAKIADGEDVNLKPVPVNMLIDSTGKLLKRQGLYDFYGRNRTLG